MKSYNKSTLKNIIKKILGLETIGKIEYYLNNNLKEIFGGPFNGQKIRKQIFLNIISEIKINYIVETGTFRGSTTVFFAQQNIPVYSVELHARYFGYSKMRLKKYNNVILFNNNSLNFLEDISNNDLFTKSKIFFYLDAHGFGKNLPLRKEVELIFNNFNNSIVMIDDFEVPNTNYGFDARLGYKLNINFLDKIIQNHKLNIFFPLSDLEEETGSKRGMVILCKENDMSAILENNNYLYKYLNH